MRSALERLLKLFVDHLLPEFQLQSSEWESIWLQRQRKSFLSKMPIILGLMALLYIFHHFFVDRPQGLNWATYRFGAAGACVFLISFYHLFGQRLSFYRLPACLLFIGLSYLQARTIVWFNEVPYIYSLIMVIVFSYILQMNMAKSLAFAVLILFLQHDTFVEANIDYGMLTSVYMITIGVVILSRLNFFDQIRIFVAERENEKANITNIENNKEYTRYIQRFLPPEISRRIRACMAGGVGVQDSVKSILQPEQKEVVLFRSDIRRFTQLSKNISYLPNSVLPDLKFTTVEIDKTGGISRKIGDLVFAYYDCQSIEENIIGCMRASLIISAENLRRNKQAVLQERIDKQCIITSGQAVVGNIGDDGTNIEITALGEPVNFASRIEDYVKAPERIKNFQEGSIFICSRTKELVTHYLPGFEVQKHFISDGFIKDFEDVKEIFIVPTSENNINLVSETYLNRKEYRNAI